MGSGKRPDRKRLDLLSLGHTGQLRLHQANHMGKNEVINPCPWKTFKAEVRAVHYRHVHPGEPCLLSPLTPSTAVFLFAPAPLPASAEGGPLPAPDMPGAARGRQSACQTSLPALPQLRCGSAEVFPALATFLQSSILRAKAGHLQAGELRPRAPGSERLGKKSAHQQKQALGLLGSVRELLLESVFKLPVKLSHVRHDVTLIDKYTFLVVDTPLTLGLTGI